MHLCVYLYRCYRYSKVLCREAEALPLCFDSCGLRHLVNKEGNLCVQLAENRDNQTSSKFRLPGCRVLANETTHGALQRLLQDRLNELAPAVHIVDVRTDVSQEVSSASADAAVSLARPNHSEVPVKSSVSSVLALLPQPVVSFEGAQLRTHTDHTLAHLNASMGWGALHVRCDAVATDGKQQCLPFLQPRQRRKSPLQSATSDVIPHGAIVRVYQWWPKETFTELEPR
eukprot:2133050-Amphidinium_carterae.1